jgi:mRNA interferase YafQ
MRFVKQANAFKRSCALMKKRGKDTDKIHKAISLLANDLPLPVAYKDHPLSGNFVGFRDIHVEPDWILIYRKKDDSIEHPEGELLLEITGTHSDLFS